jgi:pseudaminic acid biosynthesis-associated methylase
MNEQELFWRGSFGTEYTARNRVDWKLRARFWKMVVEMIEPQRVLEVGCNAGWNLMALREVDPKIDLVGIDLNSDAVCEAVDNGIDAHEMSATEVGMLWAGSFDLTFTAGVLIHVAPEHLELAMASIANASRKYVLAIEYASEKEEQVDYRGHKDRLWRRPYGDLYEKLGLTLQATGILGQSSGFDHCTFWLMKK